AVFAATVQFTLAEEARAAGDGEGDHHAIPDADAALVHAAAEFFDDAHGFVAHDVPGFHEGDEAVEQVQVRATDAGGGDADDGVAGVENLGIGDVFDGDFVGGAPG